MVHGTWYALFRKQPLGVRYLERWRLYYKIISMMAGTVKPTKEQVTVSQCIKHSANITMGLCTAAYQL